MWTQRSYCAQGTPDLTIDYSVTLSRLLNICAPWIPHLWNGENSWSDCVMRLKNSQQLLNTYDVAAVTFKTALYVLNHSILTTLGATIVILFLHMRKLMHRDTSIKFLPHKWLTYSKNQARYFPVTSLK